MNLRNNSVEKLGRDTYDVLILGGGINGAVSAASLAAKGAKVALIDRSDFAAETSSQSSNLAWGGIKYLESYEYLLVNKLCKSRNHLMKSYPSTVREIRFLTTIANGFRYPAPLVFMGTILYWIFGRFVTRAPAYHSVKRLNRLESIIDTSNTQGGFEYSDCYLFDNDARFVFNFIRSSMDYGCDAVNYVESLGSERIDGVWHTKARDNTFGKEFTIKSKVLINACGPFVDQHNQITDQNTDHQHLFSKGIHLIVDRLTEEERVLAFFASDGRLFFVIPMGPKTCIGTTDTQVESPITQVTEEDRQFVLDNVNALLNLDKPLTKDDIISERCGVRPLAQKSGDGIANWVKLSRKHAIDVNSNDKHLSIFGGKLTDCINVGDEISDIVHELGIDLPAAGTKWYGEPNESVRLDFINHAKSIRLDELTDSSSPELLSSRLWRRYGAEAFTVLDIIKERPESGKILIENTQYLRAEIEFIAQREMIVKLDDFLRRRSKVALVVRNEDLLDSPGLKTACEILFGEQADEKFNEYFEKRKLSKKSDNDEALLCTERAVSQS